MATAFKTKTNVSAKVDEYECNECTGKFVMLAVDEPSYCPLCGEELDLPD